MKATLSEADKEVGTKIKELVSEFATGKAGTFVIDDESFKLDDDRIIEHLVLSMTASR